MKLEELIERINKCVDEYDYVTARKYIEENIELLKGNQIKLKSNAREILKFLVEQKESGVKPIARTELNIINTINSYAYKFDLRGIKTLLKDNAKLFLREDVVGHLNSDAKTILAGMGVIKKG